MSFQQKAQHLSQFKRFIQGKEFISTLLLEECFQQSNQQVLELVINEWMNSSASSKNIQLLFISLTTHIKLIFNTYKSILQRTHIVDAYSLPTSNASKGFESSFASYDRVLSTIDQLIPFLKEKLLILLPKKQTSPDDGIKYPMSIHSPYPKRRLLIVIDDIIPLYEINSIRDIEKFLRFILHNKSQDSSLIIPHNSEINLNLDHLHIHSSYFTSILKSEASLFLKCISPSLYVQSKHSNWIALANLRCADHSLLGRDARNTIDINDQHPTDIIIQWLWRKSKTKTLSHDQGLRFSINMASAYEENDMLFDNVSSVPKIEYVDVEDLCGLSEIYKNKNAIKHDTDPFQNDTHCGDEGNKQNRNTKETDSLENCLESLTFNLKMTEEQKLARSQVVLPYIQAQHQDIPQGLIYYEPTSDDDFDDDDPDADLDV